ncbi:hypothetical protein CFC21_038817 [Triticum aestivum]|uniref:Pectinesterase inhibitor domain-containing protein n=3 Tax=Triticum TaxID=4564 RepID=A0A077RNU2_WHEAT|nr:hypothetical protein CFC21_038817 [Triticum aestivum]CDM80038.1 unnamed protein product [Triticum aestivum]CDM80062.1 unnamed protein product [Triticum aestivum]VAH70639.1 unnamed protein product [Triticum turgidum subsp. durum]
MVLVVLATLSYGLPAARSDIDFIARTCKKTTNPALCVAVLSADPKSSHASTEHDLASVALQIATSTAKKNAAVICDLGASTVGNMPRHSSPVADMDRETTERCGVAGDLIGLLITK